jgi:hypothetical protein
MQMNVTVGSTLPVYTVRMTVHHTGLITAIQKEDIWQLYFRFEI